jgi:hypothetical protein
MPPCLPAGTGISLFICYVTLLQWHAGMSHCKCHHETLWRCGAQVRHHSTTAVPTQPGQPNTDMKSIYYWIRL